MQNDLTKRLRTNDTVVFACSGGPDSMCLFHQLKELQKKIKITLICAHVNHKKRPESDEEFQFVKKYCEEQKVIFEGTEFNHYKKGNFEATAHQMRRDFFETIIKKYHANYFMTAHHGDDLTETILMRLTRGSTFLGYAGFQAIEKRENYTILRPLITMTKESIIDYNKKHNIPFVNDPTNEEDDYLRNRYRHHLLPILKKENKNIHLKFLKYQEKICQINEFLVKIMTNALTECVVNDNVLIDEFKGKDPLIQQMVLENYLYQIYQNDIVLIKEIHQKNILNLILSPKSTGLISLPQKKVGIKSYQTFRITTKSICDNYHKLLKNKSQIPNGYCLKKVENTNEKNNNVIRLNSEEIKLPLYVRTRKNGDKIASKNVLGHQKIKDIFINHKIPQEKRNSWPIVVDSNDNILWIPGLKKSKFDKEITEKYDIIYKYEICKEKNYVTKK
ncbi:MAG: tRNA lysidine(34) synthetase TilS [Bacilli bacterium]|nr:tRNA lysidine(34) synthetase TilS [Bacilli bacterium]